MPLFFISIDRIALLNCKNLVKQVKKIKGLFIEYY